MTALTKRLSQLKSGAGGENTGLLLMLAVLVLVFSIASPRFLNRAFSTCRPAPSSKKTRTL